MEYYNNLVKKTEYGGEIKPSRWRPNSKIGVNVVGGNNMDLKQILKIFKEISHLTGLTFVKTHVDADINIHITNPTYYRDNINSDIDNHMSSLGFFSYSVSPGGYIKKGDIFILDSIKGIVRSDVIREECTQIMGIPNDNLVKGSIFYKHKYRHKKFYRNKYTEIDKWVIMYHYRENGLYPKPPMYINWYGSVGCFIIFVYTVFLIFVCRIGKRSPHTHNNLKR